MTWTNEQRSPRHIKGKSKGLPQPGKVNVTLVATYRCNLKCQHCDQYCNLWDQPESDVTLEQVARFCDDALDLPLEWIRITGGEPTLHPQFAAIVELIDKTLVAPGHARYAGVDTNGKHSPLDLPDYWGEIQYPDKGRHNAMLISPEENGWWEEGWDYCRIQHRCGIGFDFRGWSFCHLAPNLQALLGIDRKYDQPGRELDQDVCRHCIWSQSRRRMQQATSEVFAGRILWPSKVFRPGLEQVKKFQALRAALESPEWGQP
jgi:hypothetical protein